MKKALSMALSFVMLLSVCFMSIPASAAEMETVFMDGEGFYFSFENESDFSNPNMKLDNIGNTAYVSADMARYIPGANGSKGAVGIRVNDNVNDGFTNIKAIPGKDYELSLDFKLFATDHLTKVPDLHFFFFVNKNTVYVDEACTQSAVDAGGGGYAWVTISGSEIDFGEGDWKNGDWGHLNTTITLPRVYDKDIACYTKPGELATYSNVFMRIGGNAHAMNSNAGFTTEFLAEIEAGTQKRYYEYGLDNLGMRPVSFIPPTEEEEPEVLSDAMWYTGLESADWPTETPDVTFDVNFDKNSTLITDVPEELKGKSENALRAFYSGNTINGGYLDFDATVYNNDLKPWYNRVYEISYWARYSPAMVEYYAKNPAQGLQLIPERGDAARLDRTISKWQGFPSKWTPTTEWKKYTFYYYEEMPMAIGRDTEGAYKLYFHVRHSNVPGKKTNDLTTEDGTAYAWANGENYYKLEDFYADFDNFTVKPLDIVYNGDFSKETDAAGVTSVWYTGADNKIASAENQDLYAASIFHNGEIVDATDFPENASKKALAVTENGGAPYQNVDVENKRPYTITFWAKANDAASVGKSVNMYFDRDLQGEVLDNTVTAANTLGYDGYGDATGVTGSVPFYLYSGSVPAVHKKPGTLKLENNEALVYDDYYDRTFSKNTQAGKDASAWLYQYNNGTEWVGTNDKTTIASADALTAEWKQYTYTYQWDYEGKHYRMPKMVFADNANYSITDISIAAGEATVDPETVTYFHADNAVATGKDVLSIKDSIYLTWDIVSDTKDAEVFESDNSLIKMYERKADGSLSYIAAARADRAGYAEIKATTDMFGKDLTFEVIPVDVDNRYGVSAFGDFLGKVALTYDSTLTLGADANSVDYKLEVQSAGAEGNVTAYLALYGKNNKLLSVKDLSFQYVDGKNAPTGNVAVPDDVLNVKLFMWGTELEPLTTVKSVAFDPVVPDPFQGDNEINVVYLGDSIYQGAGSTSNNNRWVNIVGAWYTENYAKNGVTVNNYYKGVGGTTTEYSLARIERDVAAYNPDLVYISATCNDGARDSRRNLESMVRTLRALPNPPYIVLTRTTGREYTTSYGFVEQVAEHYNLPLIDDLAAFQRATAPGTGVTMVDLFADGAHPNDAGYKVLAAEIIARMETGRYFGKPSMREDKLMENSGIIKDSQWFFAGDSAKVTATGNWTNGGSYFQSNAVGDTLEFTFAGNILSFEYSLNGASLPIEVWVDGVKVQTANPYYQPYSGDKGHIFQLVGRQDSIVFDLPMATEDNPHKVKLVLAENSTVTGTPATRIHNIMTGTLEQ